MINLLLLHVVDLVLLHLGTATLVLLAKQQGGVGVLEQHLFLSRGHFVDAVIRVKHNGAGNPEGDAGGDEGVNFVDDESTSVGILHTVKLMFFRRIPVTSVTFHFQFQFHV